MSKTTDINSLFKAAHDAGDLSAASINALNIIDPGLQIQNALGVDVDDVQSSEVVLVTTMIDDSASMRPNRQIAEDGHNEVLDALKGSSQSGNVLVHTRLLNGSIISPYCALDQAKKLDQSNYRTNLGTPLYDQSIALLGTVVAKSQEFSDNGVPVRTVTLIVTDGADLSSKSRASDVKALVDDMLNTELHIIAFMGIDDGGRTDFRQVAKNMGIQDNWILTPGNSSKEIREAFALFSQSAVRASQGSASFSKAAMGGFGS